jgi:7-carboxy-7-deazaguanine synthase
MLQIAERFTSIQGEGLNTGTLTHFVRFAGCNLRCLGWPCDTPHAKNPCEDTIVMDTEVLLESILDLQIRHICLTGGEPFMQEHGELDYLIKELTAQKRIVDIFTNMSIDPEPNPAPSLGNKRVFVVYDFKLPSSGEFGASKLDWIFNSQQANTAVKFVFKNQKDLLNAEEAIDYVQRHAITTIFTPVWGPQVHMVERIQMLQNDFPTYLRDEKARILLQTHRFIGAK